MDKSTTEPNDTRTSLPKHTPGPWIFDGQSILVGNTRHMLRDGVGWSQADARLIAAAPELLAACKNALGYFEALVEIAAFVGEQAAVQSKIAALNTAIAKAESEPTPES